MKKLLLLSVFFFYNFITAQSIVSITPNNGNRAQNLEVTITGQNVDFNATSPTINVSFIDQFSNIIPASYFYPGFTTNQLHVGISIPGYAIPGQYDVNVSESNGTYNMTSVNGFTVNNAYTYTIQGNVRYDSNGNGCDVSDMSMPNQRINFTSGSTTGSMITNNSGNYSYYDIHVGNYNFSPALENPSYFTISPPSASVNVSSSNYLVTQDFCIAPNGTHNDLEVSFIPITNARPGFDAVYKLVYKNLGTHVQSGTVSLNFGDSVLDLVTAIPAATSQGTDMLNWNFSNLMPFETRQIYITLNVNSPAEIPAVNAGNLLAFIATITGATDETPANNTSNLIQTVVGSIDPNDKTCVEGHNLPINDVGKYLHYVIRFENTGTANAETVVVRDVIDTSKFDMSTLRPLSGSHSFTTKISNTNLVEFIFENINLPFDDASNDGYVAFKIKTKPTLTIGTNISNTANIYFDYNLPVITNTYTTTVFNPLSVDSFEFSDVYALSPVPTMNTLTITTKQDVIMSSVGIYNTIGQLVLSVKDPNEVIDVSGLKTGVYFIKITSDKGTLSSRFIKE
jgi:uncharacterized repeat protein (TIGR01451 family)